MEHPCMSVKNKHMTHATAGLQIFRTCASFTPLGCIVDQNGTSNPLADRWSWLPSNPFPTQVIDKCRKGLTSWICCHFGTHFGRCAHVDYEGVGVLTYHPFQWISQTCKNNWTNCKGSKEPKEPKGPPPNRLSKWISTNAQTVTHMVYFPKRHIPYRKELLYIHIYDHI